MRHFPDEIARQSGVNWVFRLTAQVEPDVLAPLKAGLPPVTGWILNTSSRTVEWGWSTNCSYGYGGVHDPEESQVIGKGPKNLFSSKLLALRCMRANLERTALNELNEIDDWIAEETKGKAL